MKKFTFVFALTAFLSVAAFADIRLPDTPNPAENEAKSIDSAMVIRLSEQASEAKLIIPKSQLKQLRAALDDADDAATTDTALMNSGGTLSRMQTVVSGLFISLALVFGGVWFARSGRGKNIVSKRTGAGVVLLFVGSLTTLVYANAGPPRTLRKIDGNLFDKKVFGGWNFARGAIKIELSNTADGVELIVPDKIDKPKGEE